MPRFGVILVAAGRSSRFADPNYKKPFAPLAGRPVWLHSAEKFADRDDVEFVAIHDAARPCLAASWIDRVFAAAVRDGAAVLGTPVVSTLKRVSADGLITETVDRTGLWEAQTPQVFRRDLLTRAFAHRRQTPSLASTDEACIVEALGEPVRVVEGSPINLKITSRDDLRLAEQALKALPKPKLPGPAHPFAGDDLWR
jgi:2-C-methyl-D-erythritol 4-phosphate cytidylyltransferase